MRIAFFSDVFLDGKDSLASEIKILKETLEKLGHTVIVFCPGEKSNDKTIVAVPTCRFLKFDKMPLGRKPEVLERWFDETYANFSYCDVVHVFTEGPVGILGMIVGQKNSLPIVLSLHERADVKLEAYVAKPCLGIASSVLNSMDKKYLVHDVALKPSELHTDSKPKTRMWETMIAHANFADAVIVPSRKMKDKLKFLGVKRPVLEVPRFVADKVVLEKSLPRRLEENDRLRILWNDRISNEKRMMELLEALGYLDTERGYELFAYGSGQDFKKAVKYAERRRLNVKFYGNSRKEEFARRIKTCHIGVINSFDSDDQPLFLAEAVATGLPLLVCDADVAENLPRGGYMLAKTPRVSDLAILIEKTMSNADAIERMSRVMLNSRREVAASTQVKKILNVYARVKRK